MSAFVLIKQQQAFILSQEQQQEFRSFLWLLGKYLHISQQNAESSFYCHQQAVRKLNPPYTLTLNLHEPESTPFSFNSDQSRLDDEKRQSHLAVDELLLHVHVLTLRLQRRAERGTSAEQPVVELLGLAVITLQGLFLPLLL